jgi:hypothetical protein
MFIYLLLFIKVGMFILLFYWFRNEGIVWGCRCQLQIYFTVTRCSDMLCQSTQGKHPRALCTVYQKLRQKGDKIKLCLSFIIILNPSYQALSKSCMCLVMVAGAKIRIRQCSNFGSLKLWMIFEEIWHHFPHCGHSFLPCDSHFSVREKCKGRGKGWNVVKNGWEWSTKRFL